MELRYRTNQLIFLFAENLRLGRRQRVHRVGDGDHIARLVEQKSALTRIVFPLGLHRQFDGSVAIGEGAASGMIDQAGHGANSLAGEFGRPAPGR